jgi:hypothetical protein
MSAADTPNVANTEAARIVPALHPRFLTAAEHVRTTYVATIPQGVEPEDLEKPTFWSHLGYRFRPWDRIEAIAEDGRFYVELLVLSANATDAHVITLNKRKLQAVHSGEGDLLREHTISHTPATNWRVVRKSDKREVASGLNSRDDAITWLTTNRRTG